MLKYIDNKTTKKLSAALALSITKKEGVGRESAIAISKSGKSYTGAIVESDTNIFNIPAEQVAIMLSTISNDYKVCEVITMIENQTKNINVSPIVLKIFKDHSIRSKIDIKYKIVNKLGEILFSTDNTNNALPYYKPDNIVLSKVDQKPSPFHKKIKVSGEKDRIKNLKSYAILGLQKNFPLYDSASGYATAVIADEEIFFAGQYSSPDKRLGLHSEVNAVLSSLMSKNKKITHIGLVSTKYTDSPCNMCGNCRQFIYEIFSKFNLNPKLYLFSKDTNDFDVYLIKDYLPAAWTSKKWLNKN